MFDASGHVGDAIMGVNANGEPEMVGFEPAPPALPFHFAEIKRHLAELEPVFSCHFHTTHDEDHEALIVLMDDSRLELSITLAREPALRIEEQIDPDLDQRFLLQAFDVWAEHGPTHWRLVEGEAMDSMMSLIAERLCKIALDDAHLAMTVKPVEFAPPAPGFRLTNKGEYIAITESPYHAQS